MNIEQAKNALLLFRPGAVDADVPELSEALNLTKHDPALRQWFEVQSAAQQKIRESFRSIVVPEGLREQIVSERPWHTRKVSPKLMLTMAVAALILLAGVTATAKWLRYRDATSFVAYQRQMIATALNDYGMNLETDNLQAIHDYLAGRQAPADYVLPSGLEKTVARGCVAMRWRQQPVTMICLRTAPKSPAEQGNDVWFFVVDETAARGAPVSSEPKYTEVSGLGTASWSSGGRTYLLAARGGRPVIKELLGGVLD